MPPKRKIVDQPAQMDAVDDGPAARRSKRRNSAGPVDVPAKRPHTAKHDQDAIVEETVVTEVTTVTADKHVHFTGTKPDVAATSSVTSLTQEAHQSQPSLPSTAGLPALDAGQVHARTSREGGTQKKRRSKRNQSLEAVAAVDGEFASEEVRELDEESVQPSEDGKEPTYPDLANAEDEDDVMIVGAVEPINHIALLDGDHEHTIKGLEHQIINLEAKVQHWLIAYQSWLLKLEPYALMPSPENAEEKMDHAVDGVLAHLAKVERRASDAEAALDAIDEEIKSLGFEGEGFEAIVASIAEQFRKTRLALEHLVPGETVVGFDNSKLLQSLMERMRVLVQKVKEGENTIKTQRHEQMALREQFNITLETLGTKSEQVKDLKSKLENQSSMVSSHRTKITHLEADVGEKERSIEKLQQALQGYRTEVANLEKLITQLETDHKATTAQLQRQMNEALAAAESKAVAEANGRQVAEAAVVERNNVVAELEARLLAAQRDTEEFMGEMQTLLAVREHELIAEHQGREAAEAAVAGKNQVIAEAKSKVTAEKMNTNDIRTALKNLLADSERKLAEEKKGHSGAVATVKKLAKQIDTLQEKLNANEKHVKDTNEKLKAAKAEKDNKLAEQTAARKSAEGAVKEKEKVIASYEKKLEANKKQYENDRANHQAQLSKKEAEIVKLKSAAFEQAQKQDVALASKDQQIEALNQQIHDLTADLATANENITALTATNTALEARVLEEIEHGTKAVEQMQAEMMRSLARVSDVKNTYVRQTKSKTRAVVVGGGGDVVAAADVDVNVRGGLRSSTSSNVNVEMGMGRPPSTPMNTVRFTDVEVTSSGKRQKMSGMNGGSGMVSFED